MKFKDVQIGEDIKFDSETPWWWKKISHDQVQIQNAESDTTISRITSGEQEYEIFMVSFVGLVVE